MQHTTTIDHQLLNALAEGERDAAEYIYKQHHKMVMGWIIQRGGEFADAEDVFQEAMVVLFEKAQSDSFRLSCKIGTYLFAVSKHLWYKKLKQNQKWHLEGDDDTELAYEEDIIGHEEREMHYEQLETALVKLGEPCSTILKAFYQEGKTMQDIATEQGYTNTDSVKTQKYKCLNRLRKIFYDT